MAYDSYPTLIDPDFDLARKKKLQQQPDPEIGNMKLLDPSGGFSQPVQPYTPDLAGTNYDTQFHPDPVEKIAKHPVAVGGSAGTYQDPPKVKLPKVEDTTQDIGILNSNDQQATQQAPVQLPDATPKTAAPSLDRMTNYETAVYPLDKFNENTDPREVAHYILNNHVGMSDDQIAQYKKLYNRDPLTLFTPDAKFKADPHRAGLTANERALNDSKDFYSQLTPDQLDQRNGTLNIPVHKDVLQHLRAFIHPSSNAGKALTPDATPQFINEATTGQEAGLPLNTAPGQTEVVTLPDGTLYDTGQPQDNSLVKGLVSGATQGRIVYPESESNPNYETGRTVADTAETLAGTGILTPLNAPAGPAAPGTAFLEAQTALESLRPRTAEEAAQGMTYGDKVWDSFLKSYPAAATGELAKVGPTEAARALGMTVPDLIRQIQAGKIDPVELAKSFATNFAIGSASSVLHTGLMGETPHYVVAEDTPATPNTPPRMMAHMPDGTVRPVSHEEMAMKPDTPIHIVSPDEFTARYQPQDTTKSVTPQSINDPYQAFLSQFGKKHQVSKRDIQKQLGLNAEQVQNVISQATQDGKLEASKVKGVYNIIPQEQPDTGTEPPVEPPAAPVPPAPEPPPVAPPAPAVPPTEPPPPQPPVSTDTPPQIVEPTAPPKRTDTIKVDKSKPTPTDVKASQTSVPFEPPKRISFPPGDENSEPKLRTRMLGAVHEYEQMKDSPLSTPEDIARYKKYADWESEKYHKLHGQFEENLNPGDFEQRPIPTPEEEAQEKAEKATQFPYDDLAGEEQRLSDHQQPELDKLLDHQGIADFVQGLERLGYHDSEIQSELAKRLSETGAGDHLAETSDQARERELADIEKLQVLHEASTDPDEQRKLEAAIGRAKIRANRRQVPEQTVNWQGRNDLNVDPAKGTVETEIPPQENGNGATTPATPGSIGEHPPGATINPTTPESIPPGASGSVDETVTPPQSGSGNVPTPDGTTPAGIPGPDGRTTPSEIPGPESANTPGSGAGSETPPVKVPQETEPAISNGDVLDKAAQRFGLPREKVADIFGSEHGEGKDFNPEAPPESDPPRYWSKFQDFTTNLNQQDFLDLVNAARAEQGNPPLNAAEEAKLIQEHTAALYDKHVEGEHIPAHVLDAPAKTYGEQGAVNKNSSYRDRIAELDQKRNELAEQYKGDIAKSQAKAEADRAKKEARANKDKDLDAPAIKPKESTPDPELKPGLNVFKKSETGSKAVIKLSDGTTYSSDEVGPEHHVVKAAVQKAVVGELAKARLGKAYQNLPDDLTDTDEQAKAEATVADAAQRMDEIHKSIVPEGRPLVIATHNINGSDYDYCIRPHVSPYGDVSFTVHSRAGEGQPWRATGISGSTYDEAANAFGEHVRDNGQSHDLHDEITKNGFNTEKAPEAEPSPEKTAKPAYTPKEFPDQRPQLGDGETRTPEFIRSVDEWRQRKAKFDEREARKAAKSQPATETPQPAPRQIEERHSASVPLKRIAQFAANQTEGIRNFFKQFLGDRRDALKPILDKFNYPADTAKKVANYLLNWKTDKNVTLKAIDQAHKDWRNSLGDAGKDPATSRRLFAGMQSILRFDTDPNTGDVTPVFNNVGRMFDVAKSDRVKYNLEKFINDKGYVHPESKTGAKLTLDDFNVVPTTDVKRQRLFLKYDAGEAENHYARAATNRDDVTWDKNSNSIVDADGNTVQPDKKLLDAMQTADWQRHQTATLKGIDEIPGYMHQYTDRGYLVRGRMFGEKIANPKKFNAGYLFRSGQGAQDFFESSRRMNQEFAAESLRNEYVNRVLDIIGKPGTDIPEEQRRSFDSKSDFIPTKARPGVYVPRTAAGVLSELLPNEGGKISSTVDNQLESLPSGLTHLFNGIQDSGHFVISGMLSQLSGSIRHGLSVGVIGMGRKTFIDAARGAMDYYSQRQAPMEFTSNQQTASGQQSLQVQMTQAEYRRATSDPNHPLYNQFQAGQMQPGPMNQAPNFRQAMMPFTQDVAAMGRTLARGGSALKEAFTHPVDTASRVWNNDVKAPDYLSKERLPGSSYLDEQRQGLTQFGRDYLMPAAQKLTLMRHYFDGIGRRMIYDATLQSNVRKYVENKVGIAPSDPAYKQAIEDHLNGKVTDPKVLNDLKSIQAQSRYDAGMHSYGGDERNPVLSAIAQNTATKLLASPFTGFTFKVAQMLNSDFNPLSSRNIEALAAPTHHSDVQLSTQEHQDISARAYDEASHLAATGAIPQSAVNQHAQQFERTYTDQRRAEYAFENRDKAHEAMARLLFGTAASAGLGWLGSKGVTSMTEKDKAGKPLPNRFQQKMAIKYGDIPLLNHFLDSKNPDGSDRYFDLKGYSPIQDAITWKNFFVDPLLGKGSDYKDVATTLAQGGILSNTVHEALRGDDLKPGESRGQRLATAATQDALKVVPPIAQLPRDMVDPYQRVPKSAGDAVKNIIPYYSKDLPVRLNTQTGEPETITGNRTPGAVDSLLGSGSAALNAFLNPAVTRSIDAKDKSLYEHPGSKPMIVSTKELGDRLAHDNVTVPEDKLSDLQQHINQALIAKAQPQIHADARAVAYNDKDPKKFAAVKDLGDAYDAANTDKTRDEALNSSRALTRATEREKIVTDATNQYLKDNNLPGQVHQKYVAPKEVWDHNMRVEATRSQVMSAIEKLPEFKALDTSAEGHAKQDRIRSILGHTLNAFKLPTNKPAAPNENLKNAARNAGKALDSFRGDDTRLRSLIRGVLNTKDAPITDNFDTKNEPVEDTDEQEE